MKKIAFITQHLSNGGAERTISNLSLELSKDCEVYIILFNGKRVSYPYGGRIIDLALPASGNPFVKFLNLIRRIRKIKKIKQRESFDCVISFMFGANFVNVLSKFNEKTVISERNYIGAYGRNFYNLLKVKFIASMSDCDVALSKMVEYDLINNFHIDSTKIRTIYNPLDVNRIQIKIKEKSDYKFDSNIFYISNAGRLVKQKGQWHLIKAFCLFHSKYRQSRLLILGDGPFLNPLKLLVDRLNLNECVEFLGFQSNPYAIISRTSCFVFSSLYEGLGNVLLEAMACKVPIISFDCLAGPRELLAPETSILDEENYFSWHDCGVLVSRPNMNMDFSTKIEDCDRNLSLAIEDLYNNPGKRNNVVKNSYERINEFSPSVISSQWKSLF